MFPAGHQPCDVGLRDVGVSGWAHVFAWTFILPGLAAAGLTVGLLTQSVREVVISAMHTQNEFHIILHLHSSSMKGFDISFLSVPSPLLCWIAFANMKHRQLFRVLCSSGAKTRASPKHRKQATNTTKWQHSIERDTSHVEAASQMSLCYVLLRTLLWDK